MPILDSWILRSDYSFASFSLPAGTSTSSSQAATRFALRPVVRRQDSGLTYTSIRFDGGYNTGLQIKLSI